ncbi:hypothetical protein F0D90_02015, partial [Escherichia coli]|nr:hypothetical protein [Escherichia coli]
GKGLAGVNSRVATALVGCTAPVLKSHTHIKNRGAENSLYLTPIQNLNHLSSLSDSVKGNMHLS